MRLKVILISFTAIFLISCKSNQFNYKPPFKVISATYSNWVGGQQGVSGINLVFYLESKESINFQKIYFNKKEIKVESKVEKGKIILSGNISTSTINNNHLEQDIDKKKEIKNELIDTPFPFKLKENEAVLSYLEKDKIKFYKVEKLIRKDTNFYQ